VALDAHRKNSPAWSRAFAGRFQSIRHDTKQRGIIGCNMAFWREDILAVNGFDEDYTGWGTGEDVPTSAPGFIIWAAGAIGPWAAPSRFI